MFLLETESSGPERPLRSFPDGFFWQRPTIQAEDSGLTQELKLFLYSLFEMLKKYKGYLKLAAIEVILKG